MAAGLMDMGLDARGRSRFAFNVLVTKEYSPTFDDEIATVLEDGGVAAGDIFLTSKAVIPDGSGPYVSVTLSGGLPGVRVHNMVTGPKYFESTSLVMAIGMNTVQTKNLAWQALGLLTAVKNENVTA
jgi:hypothetical protein